MSKTLTPYEQATLQRAYEHFTGLDSTTAVRIRAPIEDGDLALITSDKRLIYRFEVKRTIFPKMLPHVLHQLKQRPVPRGARRLLITEYLTDEGVEIVRRAKDVDYVDEAGNMLLRWPGFYVEIRGRRRVSTPGRARPLATAGGMRVLFALLAQQSLNHVVYRDLEVLSGVTLGTISQTIKELRLRGLLERRRGELLRTRPQALLDLWSSGYAQWLRPQLVVGQYRSPRTLEEVVAQLRESLDETEWALTGGFAAEAMTKYYRGETLGIFVRRWQPENLKTWRWLPDEEGPITVFRPFSDWLLKERPTLRDSPVMHPLLVYAELIFDGRERPRQAAERIRDRFLRYLTDASTS